MDPAVVTLRSESGTCLPPSLEHRLLFYTDGIVDARSPDGEPFGLDRFTDYKTTPPYCWRNGAVLRSPPSAAKERHTQCPLTRR
jgi:hypothetical protein